MKRTFHLLTLLFCLAATHPASAIVGYVNHTFAPGPSLFSNPLLASPNSLSAIFSPSVVPDGTTISLWNSATLSFDTTSTFASGVWSSDFTLNPGTGALLTAPSLFTNTFVGTVLDHDGTFFDASSPTLPPLYAGPNGLFLLGDKCPINSSGNDIFLNILGRAPNVGEQVLTLTTTSTYLGGGAWDLVPSLAVSDAVFLNIGPVVVPEPATGVLSLLGFALLAKLRRQR